MAVLKAAVCIAVCTAAMCAVSDDSMITATLKFVSLLHMTA